VDLNRQIAKGFETVVLTLQNGKIVSGVLKEDNAQEVKLITAEGESLVVAKPEIEDRQTGKSAMPLDVIKHLSKTELRNLIEIPGELEIEDARNWREFLCSVMHKPPFPTCEYPSDWLKLMKWAVRCRTAQFSYLFLAKKQRKRHACIGHFRSTTICGVSKKPDYVGLIEELKKSPLWWHYLESTWLILTTETAIQLWNRIAKHIHRKDYVLVIEVRDNTSGWLPKEAWDWIRENVPSPDAVLS